MPGVLLAPVAMVLAVGCAGLSGKKKGPPPPLPPSVVLGVDHFVGTPLTGPRAQSPTTAAASSGNVPGVRVTIVTLPNVPPPADGLRPAAAKASLVTEGLGSTPVMASARLGRDARVAEGDAADAILADARRGAFGPAANVTTLTGALPDQITARFTASDPTGSTPAGRGVEVDVYVPAAPAAAAATRPAPAGAAPAAPATVRVALRVADLATMPPPPTTQAAEPANAPKTRPTKAERRDAAKAAAAPAPPAEKQMRREDIFLDRPLDASGRDRLALVVPFRFAGLPSNAVLIHVEVRRDAAGDSAHAEAVRRATADATRAVAHAKAGRGGPTPGITPAAADVRAGAYAALAQAPDAPTRRAALLYLSDQTAAPAAADVALVADDAMLAQLAQAIGDAAAAAAVAGPVTDPGWVADRATLALVSDRLAAGTLSPELTTALVRRGGDLARRPDSLADLLKAATGSQDLDNRIEAENLIALEDSSPAARVRAYDYLRSRGKAPAGYDPLGPAKARRAALEQAMAGPAPTTAPATQPVAPTAGAR